ncbi:MAG TPA: VOC family protein [Polyangiaceae bacterium]|nr:VOC family protein [Polyangiaceae bacterium]
MANPVVWFEIMGKDGAKLRTFYGDLFSWEYEEVPNMDYGMVWAKDGKGIPGGVGGGQPSTHVTFYVATPDINACLAQAEGLGAKTIMPRTELPTGTVLAMFADPDGNTVGLVEQSE